MISGAQIIKHEALIGQVLTRATGQSRLIVAITGAPAAGKSTLADELCQQINIKSGADCAVVVPMDGFHYDNIILDARGHRSRKGAPHTFDVDGFSALLARLKTAKNDVAIPVFDRAMDLARAGAAVVAPQHQIVIVEGNYLLLNLPQWRGLTQYFDMSVFLEVPLDILQQRLIQRWLDYGADYEMAKTRALSNDIPNAELVIQFSEYADFVLQD